MIREVEIGIGGHMLGNNFVLLVKDLAVSLGIEGAVTTKNDGSIRIVAKGEEADLTLFAKRIEKGAPMFSILENFYIKWKEPAQKNFFVLAGA